MAADRPDVFASSGSTVQAEIEAAMRDSGEGERWESIFLFSSEGLLMARHGFSPAYDEENLLEFAFSLIGVVRLIENDLPVKEIVVKGKEKKRLVFRYFEAWGEQVVLAAVVSGRKGFRRAIGKLMRFIRGLG